MAAATAQANLNRIDQVTPQGSLTYTQNGTNSDGTPKYTQTQTLSPAEQQKYDQSNQVATALNGLAINNVGRVADTQSQDFNFNGMTPQVTSIGGGLPGMNYGSGTANPVQTSVPDQGKAAMMPFGVGGPVQGQLDYSGLTKLPGTDDFGAEGQKMADSVYGQYTSRLDPQYQQSDSDLKSQLASQGISENSDAYRRELDNQARAKTDAYGQATYQAQQAGANEQSRLFGLALNARQQGQSETDTAGNFANAAQNQQFAQGSQTTSQNNQAQDQNYQQALGIADLFNQGQSQQFSQNQSAAGLANSAQDQAFNEQASNATLANQGRQQQETEASYLRNLPLNEIAALMGTAGGVNDPSFNPVSQVGVAAPDYQGLVASNYQSATAQYNAQQAARAQAIGSMASTAGTAASMLMMSDRRLKWDIKRIGKLANGLATYAFKYIGSTAQQFGVMAQDVLNVLPDAVGVAPNGYMFVDYGKVL